VPFPENQVGLTGKSSRGGFGVNVVAHETAVLVGKVLQGLELVAAALDGREDRRSRRHHRDVATRGAHRHFFVREEVLVKAGAAGALVVSTPSVTTRFWLRTPKLS
jgi:hypothetical protein